MRKQDLKLGTMLALSRGATFGRPVMLASLSDEFHTVRGEVGRGSPLNRGLRTGRYPSNGYPKCYIAITRSPGMANPDEFTAWVEGGPVPAEHAEYLAVASKVGDWLATLPQHDYTVVPQDLLPPGFQLGEVRTRDLAGEWLPVQQERLAAEAARAAARAERNEKLAAEKAVYDELVAVAESFGLYVKDDVKAFQDHRFVTDYARVVLPTEKLLDLLTSLRSEG